MVLELWYLLGIRVGRGVSSTEERMSGDHDAHFAEGAERVHTYKLIQEIGKLMEGSYSDNIAARAMTTDSPTLREALLKLAAEERVRERKNE